MRPLTRRPWTTTQLEKLRKLIAEGWNGREIARQTKHTALAVRTRASHLGLRIPRSNTGHWKKGDWTALQILKLQRLIAEGCTAPEVARQVKRTTTAVTQRAYQLGLRFVRTSGTPSKLARADLPELHSRLAAIGFAKRALANYLLAKGYETKMAQQSVMKRIREGWRPVT